jgi:hypothetical protein
LLCSIQVEQVHVEAGLTCSCAPTPHPVNPTLATFGNVGTPGRGVSHTSHFVDVSALLHKHVLHSHLSVDVGGGRIPAPHPVNPTDAVEGTTLTLGLGSPQTSHFVDVEALLHIHVEHSHISLLFPACGVIPAPHPVKPVVGGMGKSLAVAVCASGIRKVKVNRGSLSDLIVNAC